MYRLLNDGGVVNTPVKEYYVESEEELAEIKDAPVGSVVQILTEQGLTIKMLHSSGKWIEI